MLNFETTHTETDIIRAIASRAAKLPWPHRPTAMHIAMDITGCHCNGCPLDLNRLLAADDFNLAHDVGGIMANIDRTDGQLKNHFTPRFALPAPASIDPGADLERAIFGG